MIVGRFLLVFALLLVPGCSSREITITSTPNGASVYAKTYAWNPWGRGRFARVGTTPLAVEVPASSAFEDRIVPNGQALPQGMSDLRWDIPVILGDRIVWVNTPTSANAVHVDFEAHGRKITEKDQRALDGLFLPGDEPADVVRALGYPTRSTGSAFATGTSSMWVYEIYESQHRVRRFYVHFRDGQVAGVSN